MADAIAVDHAPPARRRIGVERLLIAGAAVAVLATLRSLAPFSTLFVLVGVLVWSAVPGVVLGRRLYARLPGGWCAALLAGPAWGYVLTSLVVLALWLLGVRRLGWLMAAPIVATAAVWPARLLAGDLVIPRFTRAELAAIAATLLAVPAIVALPYAHVGAEVPEGRAYRAYFTADMVWAAAVVSEVSKGDVPPHNPFYEDDDLHYYWLAHLLPAAEHRALRQVTIDQILLVNAVGSALAFTAFFYFFVRHFVDKPIAAALGCLFVIFCSSFEGAERIWALRRRGLPLDGLRYVNIDAVTRWFYNGMPIDGLQRLLLYQPQHQLAYLLGFSALILLYQATNIGRWRLLFLVGFFLGLSALMSTPDAAMLGVMAAVYEAWRLARGRQWAAFLPCAVAAAVPIAAAALLVRALHYVDEGKLVVLGVNHVAVSSATTVLFLSLGPVLIAAGIGAAAAIRQDAVRRFSVVWVALATAAFFYFLVDVPDHQDVYFGWHSAHLAFVAFAALCGFGIQVWWARGGGAQWAIALTLTVVALAALPMVVIDVYNTQDIDNRAQGPGFRWTVILSRAEIEGLEWIKRATRPDARVQVEPFVRDRDTWSYIPTFAERRMSYGLPISMIPLRKYQVKSAQIRALYSSTSSEQAYKLAAGLCVDYLVIGPPERKAYPKLQPMLDASPQEFAPMFRNQDLAIYGVSGRGEESACPR